MSPWTAAEAASDAVSKKMILAHLQENSSAEFLSEHKLAGQANSVLKRVTKDAMVEAYKVSLGEGGAKKGGFSFAPPAAAKAGAEAAFTFSPPAADKAAAGGKPAAGNLFGKAPPAGGPGGGGGFAFNFGSPSKGGGGDDDDDDDDDDYQDAKGRKQDIGKMLQRRMEQLNMSAAQRRDQTVAELPPVRAAPRAWPRRGAPARAASACCRSSTPPHRLRTHLRAHLRAHLRPAPRTALCTPSPPRGFAGGARARGAAGEAAGVGGHAAEGIRGEAQGAAARVRGQVRASLPRALGRRQGRAPPVAHTCPACDCM